MKKCKLCAEETMKNRRYCWDHVKKIEYEKKKKTVEKMKAKKKAKFKNGRK